MRICYVDDTGDPGVLPAVPTKGGTSAILGLVAVVVRVQDVNKLTRDTLAIKNHWPHVRTYSPQVLDRIDCEVKGAAIRKGWQATATAQNHETARETTDGIVQLLEELRAPVFGKVFVKYPGHTFDGQRLYNIALSHICDAFEAYLEAVDDVGLVIVDTRNEGKNRDSAHSIFTRKHAATGDALPHLLELPTYGDGKNHAGLQVADWLASSLIAPMAWEAYCRDAFECPEWDDGYERIAPLYRERLRALQFAYKNPDDEWRGAIHANDWRGHRSPNDLMRLPSGQHLTKLLSRSLRV